MATENTYREFIGAVQFDPEERQAGGKTVRNVLIRTTGVKDQSIRVSATLWPEFAHVQVEKGDVVYMEGKFEVKKGEAKDGSPRTFFNLSVNGIRNFGQLDKGQEVETTSNDDPDDAAADDDIPY